MQVDKPIIKSKFGYVTREGRGYSVEELKETGLNANMARRAGIPVDKWRKTKYSENIASLKPVAQSVIDQKKSKKEKAPPSETKAKEKATKKQSKKKAEKKKEE